MTYQDVPVQVLQDPYAGKTKAYLLGVLLQARAADKDPKYPELFRHAWGRAR